MIALRCVTDALEIDQVKRYEFGIKAIEQFKSRIDEYSCILPKLFNLPITKAKNPILLDELR
jgi:hypothetical protein